MKTVESVGWVARVIGGIQNFVGNYQSRVRKGLIATGDSLVYWAGNPKKKDGAAYSADYKRKKLSHYMRQWKANRKKLM